MSFTFSLGATYGENSLLQFLECKFAQRDIMDFGKNPYHILVIGQLSGHFSSKVTGSKVHMHSPVRIICRGGLTDLVRVADVYQNKAFKKVYRAEEPEAFVRRVRQDPK